MIGNRVINTRTHLNIINSFCGAKMSKQVKHQQQPEHTHNAKIKQQQSLRSVQPSKVQGSNKPMTPLEKLTNETFQKIQRKELTLRMMSLQDLSRYEMGLAIYKTDMRDLRKFIRTHVKLRQQNQRYKMLCGGGKKDQNTDKKEKLKDSENQTGGQTIGSFLLSWLRQCVFGNHTQQVKLNQQKPGKNDYSQVPEQEMNDQGEEKSINIKNKKER